MTLDERVARLEWRMDAVERNLERAATILDRLDRQDSVDQALAGQRKVSISRRDAILAVCATTLVSPLIGAALTILIQHAAK